MKNSALKAIIFISTVTLGFLISGNFNFEGFEYSLGLNATEYQNAVEEKNKLLKEVGSLKSDNKEITYKIDKYNSNDVNSEKILKDMKEELKYNTMLTGTNEVRGQGIVIIINDGVYNNKLDTKEELDSKTLHDSDVFTLLNDIKSAGAEAIAINDHRMTPLSAITCKYAFLEFEDGDMASAPFNIYAIGDAETMKSLLLQDGSYLRRLMIRGLSVELEVKYNIIMKATNISEMKYAKEYIKKN
ncbi:MAG: DUF881 domain-containing protein [Clostridium sp.]|nr:DUF881 domain-containing protein [Clostridium sp.]